MNRKCLLLLILMILLLKNLPADTWETAISGVITSPPAEGLDGRIYSTADDRALHSLNGVTGREYWSYRPGRKLIGYTTVSPDGIIYIQTEKNELIAVSPGGWELWRSSLGDLPAAAPAIDSFGRVFVLTRDNRLHIIDRLGRKDSYQYPDDEYSDIYFFDNHLILRTTTSLVIYSLPDIHEKTLIIEVEYILIKGNFFTIKSNNGIWSNLDIKDYSLKRIEPPYDNSLLYPQSELLITDSGRIVSGRKDWFMEAYQEGINSYDSYFQFGCNSSRTNSPRRNLLSVQKERPFSRGYTDYILDDSNYLNKILRELEEQKTFHQLLNNHPDYDLFLMELLKKRSTINNYRENPVTPDLYSQFRMYLLLTRWGDLRTREAIIDLCTLEDDPVSLSILIQGLGKIGYDKDGRSINSIFDILRRNTGNENLYQNALNASFQIGKYNGENSMSDFFQILQFVSDQTRSPSTKKLIQQIMQKIHD